MAVTTLTAPDVDTTYWERRAERYDALRVVWRVSEQPRLAKCRRVPNGEGVEFRVRGEVGSPGARVGVSGLQTCGSVWACPVCSEAINAERQADVETAITNWRDQGGEVLFTTLTVQHQKTDKLADLWDAVALSWTRMTTTRAWKRDVRGHFGMGHYIRLVEVKHGANGWHVHLHVLLFLNPRTADNRHYVN